MVRTLLLAITLSACFALQVHAQSTFGDVRGATRDPSGLPLPAAAVILHSLGENTDQKMISANDVASSSQGGKVEKQLFPDQAKMKHEEQRRWELTEVHWDLPIPPDRPERD
jgi:hypothetical protein